MPRGVKKDAIPESFTVERLVEARNLFWIKGTSPFVFNAIPEKARQQLLVGGRKASKAELGVRLKHDPTSEFRSSVYRFKDNTHQTRLWFPANAPKLAMATMALDLGPAAPGLTKSVVGRLVRCLGTEMPIFGIPELFMTMVKTAGMNRVPDARTRAMVKYWCAPVEVAWPESVIPFQSLANLLGNSGSYIGLGDGRQEKGKLSYGSFEVVNEDDPDVQILINSAGRDAQDAALANPQFATAESEEMYRIWQEGVDARQKQFSRKTTTTEDIDDFDADDDAEVDVFAGAVEE